MKIFFILSFFILFTNISLAKTYSQENESNQSIQERNIWLKQKFSEQHRQLIPVIAVADMFYACNFERKTDPTVYQLNDLILTMDKNTLAQKLMQCLGEDTIKSEVAINFGLKGCFHSQLAHLSAVERQKKMQLVNSAITSLSSSERQKSLTQCVTEQAIHYLK